MMDHFEELKVLLLRHAAGLRTEPGIPRVAMIKADSTTGPLPGFYDPILCFVVQGAKRLIIGDQTLRYDRGRYFIASVETPGIGEIVEASPDHPYLALILSLDAAIIPSLLLDMPPVAEPPLTRGFGVSLATNDLVEAWLRMIRLIERPDEIPVLAPLIQREILFRLLQGPQGAMLRQLGGAGSRLSVIRRALCWIRDNYAEPFQIEDLADMTGMSSSVFHRHFKSVTAMTPIQFQKHIRLYEARRRLFAGSGNAATVAFSVGYESASQFSREYTRLFGAPPTHDIRQLRGAVNAEGMDMT